MEGKDRQRIKQTLSYKEQTGLLEGRWAGGWGKWVMAIKEGTCDEY